MDIFRRTGDRSFIPNSARACRTASAGAPCTRARGRGTAASRSLTGGSRVLRSSGTRPSISSGCAGRRISSSLTRAAAFTGARRGELRGMFWENYQNGELLIARSIWNGIATDSKSRTSKAPIPIIGKLAAKLAAHCKRLGNPTAGPMFPNGAKNAVDPDSILRRVILPALEVCEHCSKPEAEHGTANHKYERNKVLPQWYGWHAFRRGLATNLNRLGVDDSVIQRILRHSHVAVTQACYIKTASEDAKAAMQKLEIALEIALNDTYVTPRQANSDAKVVM
jgi:integrase